MNKIYENRYGVLEVEAVSPLMRVRDIRGKDFDDSIKFDLETAEQIVLITDNRRSQVVFQDWTKQGSGYLVVHDSPSMGWVVRIVRLNYLGTKAAKEHIEDHARFDRIAI